MALTTRIVLWSLALVLVLLAGWRFGRSYRQIRSILRALPAIGALAVSLYWDQRVPRRAKITLSALVVYLASPVDVIPDFLPLLGYLDDVLVVAVVLDGLVNQIDQAIVADHWKGDSQELEAVQAAARRL